ncbi:MAG: hypothetical protein WC795_00140 [Candidatus Paceibacterota bacterium]|jgi:hypothetical protein
MIETAITTETRASFLARLENRFSKVDIQRIMFAYDIAKEAHRPAKRDSGERYFDHPRALAIIAMDELGWYDANMLCGLLLHDTGEDTPIWGNITKSYDAWLESATYRLQKSFSPTVANYVIRLTKPFPDGIRFKNKDEAFDFYIKYNLFGNGSHISSVLFNASVIFLKMIDRLHNLRSLQAGMEPKIRKTIKETEEVYMKDFEITAKCELLSDVQKADAQKLLTLIKQELKNLKDTYLEDAIAWKIDWELSEADWSYRKTCYYTDLGIAEWHLGAFKSMKPLTKPQEVPVSTVFFRRVYIQPHCYLWM